MKKILALLVILLILPIVSADFYVELSADRIMGAIEGGKESMPATLYNEGSFKLNCLYKTSLGSSGNIINGLRPWTNYNFDINFEIPNDCGESCGVDTKFVCRNPDGKIYEQSGYFEIFNIKPRVIAQNIINNKPRIIERDGQIQVIDREQEDEGDGLGGLIVLALLIIIGVIIYKRIKKRLKKKREAKIEEAGQERRKLSAIMFMDMKGFSSSVEADEEKTIRKVWKFEKIIGEVIKDNQGRIVKTIGDAIMGDFDSAVNAVKCAKAIQDMLVKEEIEVRIGIHLGDVIHRKGDIYGEGVNIASRLESIGEPGVIYISDDVYRQVKGKVFAEFKSLGMKKLKNMKTPVHVYKYY